MVITNTQNILSLLEVTWRYEELSANENRTVEEEEEFQVLDNLALQLDAIRGERTAWQYNASLKMVRASHFPVWARTEGRDRSGLRPDDVWPLNYIDWDAAAVELQQQYAEVYLAGVTYLVDPGNSPIPMLAKS